MTTREVPDEWRWMSTEPMEAALKDQLYSEEGKRIMEAQKQATATPVLDLNALEKLLAEATPGPWEVSECDDLHAAGIHAAEEKYPFGTTSANEEARLIVAAVNALPALIAEMRELRADRERLDWLDTLGELVAWKNPLETTSFVPNDEPHKIVDGPGIRGAIDAAKGGSDATS